MPLSTAYLTNWAPFSRGRLACNEPIGSVPRANLVTRSSALPNLTLSIKRVRFAHGSVRLRRTVIVSYADRKDFPPEGLLPFAAGELFRHEVTVTFSVF